MSIIARACPGIFDEHHILYHLPQERGWAYVHCHGCAQGGVYEWPADVARDEEELRERTRTRMTRGVEGQGEREKRKA